MAAGGYFGRALVVDASAGTAHTLPLPDELLRAYLGGAGLGAWLMHRLAPPGVDPLAPAAPLAFVFSPLVGTPLTTSAKFAVVAKSPLTGMLNDALASSHFAIAGKLTGHDAIVVHGACERPSVLLVDGGGRAASPTPQTCGGCPPRRPRRGCGSGSGGAGGSPRSGPPGERGVRYATISHDGRHAGRGGLGAVLGAKRSRPSRSGPPPRSPPAHPDAVLAAARDLRARSFGPATAKYRELGTLANLLAFNAISTLPTRNFQAATFAGGAPAGRRGPGRAAAGRAQQLRVVHDRLRAHLLAPAAARRCGSSTRTCSRSARCAGSPTRTPCSPPARAATSSGSTRSRRAARSPGRWSAPSAA